MRRLTRSTPRLLPLATALACLIALLVPGGAAAGKKKQRAECPADQVFLKDVSMGFHKGLEPEEVMPEFHAALAEALQNEGFALTPAEPPLGSTDVSLLVSVRGWTDRAHFTGRITRGLAAKVEVEDDGARVFHAQIAPGQVSRVRNFNNGTPKSLAKRVAAVFLEACRADWELE